MDKQWTTLRTQGKEITLIGTAHVSKVSAQEVKEALEEIHPDSICIELDEDRYQSLLHPGQWEQTDIVQVIKQKKTDGHIYSDNFAVHLRGTRWV